MIGASVVEPTRALLDAPDGAVLAVIAGMLAVSVLAEVLAVAMQDRS